MQSVIPRAEDSPAGSAATVRRGREAGRDRDEATAVEQTVLVGVVALLVATSVVFGWFNRNLLLPDAETWQEGRLIAAVYDPPERDVELYLDQGDGQIYAATAQDPLVRRPEQMRGGPPEQAYRYQRPLYGWLGWAASAGRPEAVAWTMVALTVASVVAVAVVAAALSGRLGGRPILGAAMAAAPGVGVLLVRAGPEALGTALVGLGLLALWGTRRRTWLAVMCFALAGLARESFLLVPFVLVATEWWTSRPPGDRRTAALRRAASPLLLSAVPLVTWILVVRWRIGAWPEGTVDGRLSPVPFGGLASGVGEWASIDAASFVLVAVPALLALRWGRDVHLRALVVAHVALSATFGSSVWETWIGFGRVLLPMSLLSLVALASAPARRSASVGARTPPADGIPPVAAAG